MKNNWMEEILEDERHRQALRVIIEDVNKKSMEEIEMSIRKDEAEIEANKDKICFTSNGKRILMRQPFPYKIKPNE